jgi:GTP:adenosylcobinamide-phosphate guanylyltransferase/thiamine kinase-like enzyme
MIEYIIVQAGGKGTRLEHLTANKPKALVPVDNLPMLFHLFRKFPDKKFVIIADTHRKVLREYLEAFAPVKYDIVDATGTGTCSGVAHAAALIPEGEPLMLVWSDLILPDSFTLPDDGQDYVGISQTFPCRWSFKDGEFFEEPSEQFGVAGLFVLHDKSRLNSVPESGELVRWFSKQPIEFTPLGLAGTREFGVLAEYEKLETAKTRPFNKMTIAGDVVTKEAIDAQGEGLAKREAAWYRYADAHGVTAIPKIFDFDPLRMQRIEGEHPYDLGALSKSERREILTQIVAALKDLHAKGAKPTDAFSVRDAYYTKTMDRLKSIRDLVPHADKEWITINGRKCRNVFFEKREFEQALANIKVPEFTFIHGDNTFSNLIIADGKPVFIDPRGYFGNTELFGDPNYDWAKLYYSIVGNYDQFNLKRFRLRITEDGAELNIDSNGWADLADDFFELSGADERTIKLLHAVIWLSLTTYAWQDYDSICGAFYNGLYYLQEAL